MIKRFGKMSLVVLAGSLVLGGCATTGSVKRAQARADEAYGEAQAGHADARHAQEGADAAMGAAQHAQSSADAANTAAQGASSAAQAAATNAQSTGEQIAQIARANARLSARMHHLEAVVAHNRRHHTRHHHHGKTHHKAVPASETQPAQFRK